MGITERIDAVTLVGSDRFTAAPPAPKSVKIELTGRCNYRCGFCALRTRKEQPKGDMDFDLFKRITTEMREAGVEEIGAFYLGESFMAPDLLAQAIRWCKRVLEFPYVFLTTNGSLCTPNALFAVMDAGLDSLKFSINAADDKQFREVMGVKPALYREALAAVRNARVIRDDHGFKCGIYASSIRYDGAQQATMEALLAEHVLPFVDEHYWLPLYTQMASVTSERAKELNFVPTAGNQGRIGALRDPLPCWSCFTEAHVRSDGQLSACCFDSDGRFAMADLNEVRFMEGWHSQAFIKLRHAHVAKDVTGTICEGCIAYA